MPASMPPWRRCRSCSWPTAVGLWAASGGSGIAPGFWIAGLLLLTLLLALAPLSYRGIRRSDMLAAGWLLLAWAVAHGPQLALAQPVIDARTFLPFGAVLASAVLFSEAAVRRLVEERALPTRAQRDLAAPLLALVGSLAVTASSYAHAYGQQRRLEAVLLGQLGAGLDQIPADRWGQLRQIDCIGRLPRSPALAQAIRRFPCLGGGMVSPLVGNGAFGPMQLRSLTAIGLTYAPPTPERTARALAGQLPTLFESRRFQAMQDRPVLVVVTR
jgi:hypothetical protein